MIHTAKATTTAAATALTAALAMPFAADPALSFSIGSSSTLAAQVASIEVEPSTVEVTRGESVLVTVTAVDRMGRPLDSPLRVSAARGGLTVAPSGSRWAITGEEVGEQGLIVSTVEPGADGEPVSLVVPVRVGWPATARVDVTTVHPTLYAGTRTRAEARVVLVDGTERPGVEVAWRSSNPAVASVDPFSNVRAHEAGQVRLTASFEGVEGSLDGRVQTFPGAALEIRGGDATGVRPEGVRTGDVLDFDAAVLDASGRPLADVPVTWSLLYTPDDSIRGQQAPAQITDEGRFVADWPGVHTVLAAAGPLTVERSFRVTKRDVVRPVEVMSHSRLLVYTTDLWVFEGVDGRDYSITGSKTDGKSFVFDITDPADVVLTDSLQVDARTVNDVKISPDGRWGAISREGASNRRNGVVIFDLSNPAHPEIVANYDEGLTGGVHNMFATETHLFALSAGDKYVILDMTDFRNPRYVSEYDHPDSRVHDVWVYDGIAYSAEWETGVVVVDVGNGRWGGTIENPVFVTAVPLPSGSTHAVFPYYQEETGNFYIVAGDEDFDRSEMPWQGNGPLFRQPYDPETGTGGYPRASTGYIQFIDFTDPETPEMVARYEVPEFGTHNIWVEDDILYQAYYEGGVRMVDVSGDLMGNLFTQDREIAVFKANDPIGYIPNSPGAWSVIPHKGHIFFSDINSGLWSIRLSTGRPVS